MMKTPAVTALILALFAASASGQTAPPPAPDAPQAASATAPDVAPPTRMKMTRDGKPRAKVVRQACRAEAISRRLNGLPKQQAISDCVLKQRPDLASREQCRMDGREKGLKKEDLRAFVKDCVGAKG